MPTTFANTISLDGGVTNLPIYADRAEKDAAGNDLQTTYATKTEVTTGLTSKEDASNKAQTLDPSSTTDFPSSAATASFVNSSVATATANFLGNFTLAELGLTYPATDAQIGAALDSHTWPAGVTPTNNDYTYIEIENPQTTGIDDSVERFKFNGSNWVYEYTLNNSSFTAAEKAAIDSGIDSAKVAVYDAHVANSDIHVTLSDKSTWNAKQDAISDLSDIRSGAAAGATAVQPGDLAAVATTGDYSDLSNKPDLSVYAEAADLATVATTGAYSDLSGTPTIPTATSNLTNDSGFITLSDVPAQVQPDWDATSGLGEILHKPDLSVYAETADLATVATTGSYTDLSNKPNIPTATSDLTNDSGFITLSDVPAQVNADWNSSSGASEILHKPDLSIYAQSSSLATVATTGDYDDLTNKPTIPAAQVNSDWNAVSGVSEILNKPTLATVATTGAYSDLNGKPTVDQTYDAASSSAQSGTAVAQAISSVDAVPDVTSSDNGKVLIATYSGGAGSYVWGSTPPANAIILDDNSTWSDFHTPYSAGRKDIYYKYTNPNSPFDSHAELYLHLTAISNVDGTSINSTYALFEGAWHSDRVDYTIRCQFRYSGNPIVYLTALTVEQSYSSSSYRAQSGVAVAQAISAVNQVPASTSADADKVLTVDAQGTPAWASAQAPITAGNGIDITNNVVSVDTSVVATQTDLAGKEDAFDVGTGLEMDTSGATPTLQVEAPVDIVAGTGIAIDNPDGNTMRITNTGFPISETDAVRCGTFRGDPMYTKTYTFTSTVGTSETTISMTIDEKKGTNNVNRIWIDPSTSFILYGSAGNNFLPLSWRLGSGRQGSVAVLGASTGSLSCRCVDTSSTPITLNITIRYTVSNS